MTLYCRVTLETNVASQPEELPEELRGLSDEALSNFDVSLDPAPDHLKGAGFWPVDVTVPEFDPREQALTDTYDLDVDIDAQRVEAKQVLRDLTDEEKGELPPIAYANLTRLGFIRHVQDSGEMTDDMLVDAQRDEAFAAFWIKFQMTDEVHRDDPMTLGSLQALEAAGYLPKGADAVIEAWPKA